MSLFETAGDGTLPPELETRVQSELAAGERLVWVGQPRPGRALLGSLILVLFAIPWTAFAVFWMVLASGANLWFALFGVPFVVIGLGMLTAPLGVWRKARQTCYALTDRRAIVWEPGLFGSVRVRSFGPEHLGALSRVERPDGSGDLIFEEFWTRHRRSHHTVQRSGFLAIDRVREVEEMIRKTLLSR
jgi:hypothetical protein